MTRISLELDAELNQQLKQYCLDRYKTPFGRQQEVLREALIAYLITQKGKEPPTKEPPKQLHEIKLEPHNVVYGMPGDGQSPAKGQHATTKAATRKEEIWTDPHGTVSTKRIYPSEATEKPKAATQKPTTERKALKRTK